MARGNLTKVFYTYCWQMQRENPSLSGWDDLIQEGWIAAWKAASTWNRECPLIAWCIKAGKWAMLKTLRKQMRISQHNVGGEFIENYGDEVEDLDTDAICQSVDVAYHTEEIWAAVNRLPPRRKQYVINRFVKGLQGKELKTAMGWTSNGDSSFWTEKGAARDKLRHELQHLKHLVEV